MTEKLFIEILVNGDFESLIEILSSSYRYPESTVQHRGKTFPFDYFLALQGTHKIEELHTGHYEAMKNLGEYVDLMAFASDNLLGGHYACVPQRLLARTAVGPVLLSMLKAIQDTTGRLYHPELNLLQDLASQGCPSSSRAQSVRSWVATLSFLKQIGYDLDDKRQGKFAIDRADQEGRSARENILRDIDGEFCLFAAGEYFPVRNMTPWVMKRYNSILSEEV